jgi:hypothetical protein
MSDLYSAKTDSANCDPVTGRVVPHCSRVLLLAINRIALWVTNGGAGTVLAVALLSGLAVSAHGAGAELPPAAAPATQVWLVDTRCAPGCGDLDAGMARITYWRLAESSGCTQWQSADAAAFQASADPALPTVVLIHGYGTDPDWAVHHGNDMRSLMQQVGCGRPFRLVVWSWPADRASRVVRGIRPDIQMKVCRSDVDAYYMARALAGLPRGEPLSLIGFSLGCRAAGGALQLLAGGPTGGRTLPAADLQSWSSKGLRPIRAMMLAAAVDECWFQPSSPGGLAPLAVQRMLVTQNCDDRVLRFYPRLYGRGGPEAIGRVGPCGPDGGKLEVVDVACEVGGKHDFQRYEVASPVYRRLAWYTFLTGDSAVDDSAAQKAELAANHSAGH